MTISHAQDVVVLAIALLLLAAAVWMHRLHRRP